MWKQGSAFIISDSYQLLPEVYIHVLSLTTGGDPNGLLKPWVPVGRQAEGHHHHRTLGGSHQQTWADLRVCLPGETLTEVKGGDGLSRFSIYAGYAWATRAGERVILGIWTGWEWTQKMKNVAVIWETTKLTGFQMISFIKRNKAEMLFAHNPFFCHQFSSSSSPGQQYIFDTERLL